MLSAPRNLVALAGCWRPVQSAARIRDYQSANLPSAPLYLVRLQAVVRRPHCCLLELLHALLLPPPQDQLDKPDEDRDHRQVDKGQNETCLQLTLRKLG